MEEEFYATVKLLSGEELVAKVCYLPDEDKVILEKPLMVENAKQRIINKVYGICRETGKLISKERLMAVPHATLSIEAKKSH